MRDKAACGAMVAEGSVAEISHGRGYSFVTARMACRKGCTIAQLAQLGMGITEGMPYFIETSDGRTFSGRVGSDGLPPRIETYGEDEYSVLWGDEALAKTGTGKA